MKEKTIERKVSDAVLQATEEKEIAGMKFEVCPATPATLILVSGLVSQLPVVDGKSGNIALEVLHNAKDCLILGKIASALILGAKRINEHRRIKTGLYGLKTALEWDWLSQRLLEDYTIKDLSRLITERLGEMQIGDFFGLTASLSAVNVLKTDRKEAEESGE